MSAAWQRVPLGEVLRHRKHFITIDDLTTYKRCRVQLHAQGIVLRDQVPGSEINTKSQQVCRAGEFLVAEIDAKMGGFGLVPPELNGAIVSSHYFLFEIVEERLDRRFLGWYCRTPAFREQVRAQGTTNYAAIRPAHVLAYTVPLPPLAEQRRIVARLDALAAKIEEAKELRAAASEGSGAAMSGLASLVIGQEAQDVPYRQLGDFSPHVTSGPRSWSARCRAGGALRFFRAQDIRADGSLEPSNGAYIDPPSTNQGATARARPGDLLIVITGATVGRVGLFTDAHEPGFVSQHVAICRLPAEHVNPKFAHWCLRSREGVGQLLRQRYGQGKPGLNLSNLRALAIPVPTMMVQARVVTKLDLLERRITAAESCMQSSTEHLDSLLPSLLNSAFTGAL